MSAIRKSVLALAAVSLVGFAISFAIGFAGGLRLAAHPDLAHPSIERTQIIRTKLSQGFVEPDYAARFDKAASWEGTFWNLMLLSFLISILVGRIESHRRQTLDQIRGDGGLK